MDTMEFNDFPVKSLWDISVVIEKRLISLCLSILTPPPTPRPHHTHAHLHKQRSYLIMDKLLQGFGRVVALVLMDK